MTLAIIKKINKITLAGGNEKSARPGDTVESPGSLHRTKRGTERAGV